MLPFFESRSPESLMGGSTRMSKGWIDKRASRMAFGRLRRRLEQTGSAATNRFEYFRRMFRLRQVDWEFAAAQMICLCLSPGMVFDFAKFRKQTKDRWARDDPGFTMALMYVILFTSLAYGIALKTPLRNLLLAVIFPVLVYLVSGVIAATIGFLALNLISQSTVVHERPRHGGSLEFSSGVGSVSTASRYLESGRDASSETVAQLDASPGQRVLPIGKSTLPTVAQVSPERLAVVTGASGGEKRDPWLRQQGRSEALNDRGNESTESDLGPAHSQSDANEDEWSASCRPSVRAQVEWTYCFDIHSNGVFCLVLLCGVLHYMLLPLLLHLAPSVLSTIVSNALFAAALSYYFFVSSLGYSRLPIVPASKAALFLYPAVVVVLGALLLTLSNCNLTKLAIKMHIRLFCR